MTAKQTVTDLVQKLPAEKLFIIHHLIKSWEDKPVIKREKQTEAYLKIQKALSAIQSSMAEDIIKNREDRL